MLFLKAFSESEQTKLAMLTGILLANGTLPPPILTSLFSDNVVKEGECVCRGGVDFLRHIFIAMVFFQVVLLFLVSCRYLCVLCGENVQSMDI